MSIALQTMSAFWALFLFLTPAFSYCSKPSAPYCAEKFSGFDDEYEFRRCRSEMENYKSEVESYLSCLQDERSVAVRQYNDAVESFNRRARR